MEGKINLDTEAADIELADGIHPSRDGAAARSPGRASTTPAPLRFLLSAPPMRKEREPAAPARLLGRPRPASGDQGTGRRHQEDFAATRIGFVSPSTLR